jgi:hypothetical protein
MVCKTHYYYVSGICQSSGFPQTRKHNVSETESVSVLRRGGAPTLQKTKRLPYHRRYQNKRSTTRNKGIISTWPQEESMGCNKRIRSENWGRGGENREEK